MGDRQEKKKESRLQISTECVQRYMIYFYALCIFQIFDNEHVIGFLQPELFSFLPFRDLTWKKRKLERQPK